MTTEPEAAALRARRNTIGDALRRSARRFRDRPALSFGGRDWSHAALDLAADRVARRLLAADLKPGDRVLAYGRNSDGYLLAWLGCARAGLIHVPANFALTAGELEHIARQSGAAALLTQPALRATADAVRAKLGIAIAGTLDGDGADPGGLDVLAAAQDGRWGQPGDASPGEAVRDEDVAQLLYTSGTTGLPKGAMMTHRALLTEYTSCIVELEFTGADRVLASLPLYHSAQMHCFSMPSSSSAPPSC
jgi:fatty-acyl-CoA synthase